jgi:hypothetical protein
MNNPTVRLILGIALGLVVQVLVTMGVQMLGHSLYPPPAGLDPMNPEHVERIMAAMPAVALAFVPLSWFLGALLGAWAADKLAGKALAGWIIALWVAAASLYVLATIAHPAWMWAALLLPFVAARLAQRLARVS